MSLTGRAVQLFLGAVTVVCCLESRAATVYGTLFTNPGTIVRIDTVNGQVTPVLSAGDRPDGPVFDASGRIVYALFGASQVRRFDPSNDSDVLLASLAIASGPRHLALEPGAATVLVSNSVTSLSSRLFGGVPTHIDRLNLSTGVVTIFKSFVGGGGMVYDNTGRLFANISFPTDQIVQLDPTTGAVLQTGSAPAPLDGLTFDAATSNLFATDGTGGHIYRYNPNNLAASAQLLATIVPSGGFVGGIAADGSGNLFVAVRTLSNEARSGLFEVNAATGSFVQVAFASFLQDIAPLSGLGAPPTPTTGGGGTVPALSEAMLITLAVLLAALAVARLQRRRPADTGS